MTTTPNILTMPDDEFQKNFDTLGVETPPAVEPEVPVIEPEVTEPVVVPEPEVVTEPEGVVTEPVVAEPVVTEPVVAEPAAPAAPPVVAQIEEPDYKAVYEQIIGKPIKAGGKEIIIKTVDEAKQLIQMGVGFHQNMSKMAPHRRIIETLKEHGLLEESKINELIDISKKNPEAIAALVQSAGLEPHQLIPKGDAQPYQPGNHVLPENQLQFRTSVETIREQGGEEFLAHVAKDWDVTSRAEVLKDPRALVMVYDHKQNGIYDKISSEVERRKLFDPSVANLPFIHAYLAVGNDMNEKGLLAPQQEPNPDPVPATPVVAATPVPVAVKPAVATQPVAPNPAAAKAASVRSTPPATSAVPNYLTMSDDEFKKHHMVK